MILALFNCSHGCGINDGNTLVVTGGGIRELFVSDGFSLKNSMATKIVDRYNAQVIFYIFHVLIMLSGVRSEMHDKG